MSMLGLSAARGLLALCAACAFAVVAMAPAEAQRNGRDRDEQEDNENRTFSPRVGEIVVAAQEAENAEGVSEDQALRNALARINEAFEVRGGMSAYELGVVLLLRGNYYYQLDDVSSALADWERALREGAPNQEERLSLQFNVGQLYLQQENYTRAIELLEAWLAAGGQATDAVHINLVAAYGEQNDFRSALRHGLRAFELASPREKKHFDILNYLYAELNMPRERAAILRQMVALFPTEKRIWTSIAALEAQAGRERAAFEINKIMYLNGMLEEEDEIMRIVDYYSYYEVPYRGAQILQREMNRGRVDRNYENYRKLSRLYRQAQEFDLAIAPLTEAARRSDDGVLYRQLGEALYAEARYGEAETALVSALDKGGLERPGEVWTLLGNTRYESAKNSEDPVARRNEAIEAFEQAAEYRYAQSTANGWIEFIRREMAIEEEQRKFTEQVLFDEVRLACERRDTLLESVEGAVDVQALIDRRTGEPADCAAIRDEFRQRQQAG